jgi:hypothetical protein
VIVNHPLHGRTVAKLFRPGAKRFLDREIRARQELAGVPLVPRLLEHGDNWFLSPLYVDTRQHVRRTLPGTSELQLTYQAARAATAFLHELRKRRLFLLDLTSHNLITDADAGLLILDFEFLQQYREVPPLERDYTVLGDALEGDVDVPVTTRDKWRSQFANSIFHPAITGQALREPLGTQPGAFPRARAAANQLWWSGISKLTTMVGRHRRRGQIPFASRLVGTFDIQKRAEVGADQLRVAVHGATVAAASPAAGRTWGDAALAMANLVEEHPMRAPNR